MGFCRLLVLLVVFLCVCFVCVFFVCVFLCACIFFQSSVICGMVEGEPVVWEERAWEGLINRLIVSRISPNRTTNSTNPPHPNKPNTKPTQNRQRPYK